jgi:hypothetical protein
LFQRPFENPHIKKSVDTNVQYFIESLMLARSMFLGARRWMNPKNTSDSVLPNVEDLLALSDSAISEATASCRPKLTFGKFRRGSVILVPDSGAASPVNVHSVALDENLSRETRRLSVAETSAGGGKGIGEDTPVAFPGVGDEIPVVA